LNLNKIREELFGIADTVGRTKQGTLVARRGFFYRHGHSAGAMAKRIEQALPGVAIIGTEEIWKPFKGGASVAAQSHFRVEFRLPETEVFQPVTTVAEKGKA
jgi:hypothetical protein